MASTQSAKAVNIVVGADLNGAIYGCVKINGSGQAILTAAATDVIAGIIAEDPGRVTVAGEDSVPVAIIGAGGVMKGRAGATITAGQLVVPDADAGRLAGVANIGALAADQMAVGIALQGAEDGEVFEFLAMVVAAPHSA